MEKLFKGTVEEYLEYHMVNIRRWCNVTPTCEKCPLNRKHEGCYFRGRSPRDWKIGEIYGKQTEKSE